MLLEPGGSYEFNGRTANYPDIRLVYWAGGNPFHHHQDLNRLRRAWQKPETIIVHDSWWTPTARHADIVLPATTSLERNDVGGSSRDPFVFAMHRAIAPVGEARNDFDIFRDLARPGSAMKNAFTEGRDEMAWCRLIYQRVYCREPPKRTWCCRISIRSGREGFAELPLPADDFVLFEDFRRDPQLYPLGDAVRQDRDRFRNGGRLRLCRLPAASRMACSGGMAWQHFGGALAAASGHAPAGRPVA